MILSYKWSRVAGFVLLLFSLVWDAMMAFMFTTVPADFAWVGTIHAGVGLFMTYYAICSLCNTTTITADPNNLTIKIGPVPFFGNKKIMKDDIVQLYFVEKVTTNKNSVSITYQLKMINKNNKSMKLLKGFTSAEQARFIETKLEKFYKIENVRVDGQFD